MIQTDPFRDLDTLFSRLSGRPQNNGGVMPMDAFRRGSDVWVHIDLPGVKAESLDITVERNVLTIAAERNWQRQETDQPYFGERYRGSVPTPDPTRRRPRSAEPRSRPARRRPHHPHPRGRTGQATQGRSRTESTLGTRSHRDHVRRRVVTTLHNGTGRCHATRSVSGRESRCESIA